MRARVTNHLPDTLLVLALRVSSLRGPLGLRQAGWLVTLFLLCWGHWHPLWPLLTLSLGSGTATPSGELYSS